MKHRNWVRLLMVSMSVSVYGAQVGGAGGIPPAPALSEGDLKTGKEAWLAAMGEKERTAYEEERKRSEAGDKARALERKRFEETREAEIKTGLPNSGIMVMPRTHTLRHVVISKTKEEEEQEKKFGRKSERAEEEVEKTIYPSQGLVILLNDSEEGTPDLGPITFEAWAALYYKVPMLISGSLLKTTFGYGRDAGTSIERMQEIARMGGQNVTSKVAKILRDIAQDSFKSDEWIIRQVGESLVLLVPKTYVHGSPAATMLTTPGLTDLEYMLGLKIDHMPSLDGKQIYAFAASYKKPKDRDYFIKELWSSKGERQDSERIESEKKELFAAVRSAVSGPEKESALKNLAEHTAHTRVLDESYIFVTNADYASSDKMIQQQDGMHSVKFVQPQWTLYISGHGLLGKDIAFLQLEDFRRLLVFFESKIMTKLLTCKSCYIMGTNAELVYAEAGKQQQKQFSFPIALEASYDTPTLGGKSHFDSSLMMGLVDAVFYPKFNAYFKIITSREYQDNPYDIVRVVQPIFELLRDDPERDIELIPTGKIVNNYPQVRPARREYFIPLFPGIEIGRVMEKRGTKPLDILKEIDKKGVKWDWFYVVLQAMPEARAVAKQHIQFPLILRTSPVQKKVPVILSAAPGADVTLHHIDKIISEYPLIDIIKSIVKPEYNNRKVFWIGTFSDQTLGVDYTDVIIDSGKESGEVYITDPRRGKLVYKVEKNSLQTQPSATAEYMHTYNALFSSAAPQGVDVQKLLINAVASANVAKVQQALAMGANVKTAVSGDVPLLFLTPLIEKYQENEAEIVRLLTKAVAVEAEKAESTKHEPALAAITGEGREASEAKAKAYVRQVSESKEAGAKAAAAYVDSIFKYKTPLMRAVMVNNFPVARALLEGGADVTKPIANDKTVLDVANSLVEKDPVKYKDIRALLEEWK